MMRSWVRNDPYGENKLWCRKGQHSVPIENVERNRNGGVICPIHHWMLRFRSRQKKKA